jgi:hypothetical protein
MKYGGQWKRLKSNREKPRAHLLLDRSSLHCASWKHENPRRKENWQRTRRTLQQKKQMRAVKIEDDSRTQPGGDGLSRKNQNRPAGENRAPELKALKNENRFAND